MSDEPFDAFVRRVAPEHAVLILFEYERLQTQVLALENAGMETAAQLGEEQQLREEAEQSIDYYQHEIAKMRDKNQRDVQRIADMDAGIERLLAAGEDLYGALCDGQRLGDERVHEAMSAWEAVAKPPPSGREVAFLSEEAVRQARIANGAMIDADRLRAAGDALYAVLNEVGTYDAAAIEAVMEAWLAVSLPPSSDITALPPDRVDQGA